MINRSRAQIGNTQARVQVVVDQLVGSGVEAGLQVAAYLDRDLIVDAWAGVADAATGRKVGGETLFGVFSCGKGVLATAIHILADRGKLEYDTPVTRYWPEFAANGKDRITVRNVMSHMAGIPALPEGSTVEDLLDWDRMCGRIAELTPIWEPGTRTGYHARTYGYVLGEVVRRVDGRRINRFIREEISQPLGIDSMYFGIPDEVIPRVANLESGPPLASAPAPEPIAALVFPPNLPATPEVFNRSDVRRACIPSSNGIMNARALARHYAALACAGELDGVRLMSAERIGIATMLQTEDRDLVIGRSIRKGLGYFLGGDPLSATGARHSAFGHAGSGGSIGFADPDHRFALALLKTRLVTAEPGEDAAYLVAREARAALGL
jgi:CubicO group peptidase (beta-lactamase class C family)